MNTNINTSNKQFQKYVDLRQKCVDHIQRPTIHLYQCCTIESVVDAPLEPSIAEKSLLNEIRQAEDELAIVITETELANEKNQDEAQALETQYSQITASLDTLHKSQNTIREKLTGLHSIRDGLSEQQASTQNAYDTQRNYVDGYTASIKHVNNKSFLELIFRPDLTIPLLYNENTYKQNLREMNANAGILRDLSMKLNQNRDETIQLETLLYKQIDEYNTYNTEKNDLQQRLLSLSQDIVTYLEWYILYGVFRTYLESSEQTIEMDTLLQFLDVETPILTSYEDIQDALLFWRNRDTDSTYLKQKLLSL